MIARRIMFVVVMLCMSRFAWAQVVDLTRPFAVDAQTTALFHLDDVATGQVTDAVPGGKAGVVKDTLPTLGRFGKAMSCDGAKGWVDVPNQPEHAPQAGLTVECWVKFRGKAGGDIICRNSTYMIRIAGTVKAYVAIDGRWRTLNGTTAVPVDRWTHLAITYDRRSRKVSIYIDGKLDVSGVPRGVTEGKLSAGSTMLRIGSRTWGAASGILNGKLDEVRISSVARKYRPLKTAAPKPVPVNTNLLLNPSFESGMHGWRVSREANARLLWHVETGDAAPHGRSFLSATTNKASTIITYPFTIARGKSHTVSVTMKADTPCRGRLMLRCTGVGSGISRPKKTHSFRVTRDWQRSSVKFDVPADWPSASAYLEVGSTEGVKVDIDAISVVVGTETKYTQTEAQSVGINAQLPPHRTYMLKSKSSLPIEIVNAGKKDRNLSIKCTITDWLDRPVHKQRSSLGKVPVGKAATTKIRIPDDRVGWFAANFTVLDGGRLIKQATRTFNVIEPMKGVGSVMDSPLAMNTHMEREPTEHLDSNLGMLSLCGVKWIRAWWGWGMVEKQPGQFDWKEYDRQLDAVHRAGMEILPILLRYYPAWEQKWAGKVDRIQRPPYKMEQWGKFVETTVRRYRGRVKAWEVWNEPVYTMKPDYYAGLLKETYKRIKKADPKAEVIGSGGGEGEKNSYIDEVCQAGGNKSMDMVSYHSYSAIGRPFERMLAVAEAHKKVVAKHGCTRRVWHTEQGSKADGMGYIVLGQSEQVCAVNLAQSYLSASATGVEKFFWFSAQTTPSYSFAVFFENHVPRPRLIALNGLARVLNGRSVTGRMTLGDDRIACVLMDGKAGPAVALWNLGDTMTVRLPQGTDVIFTDMLCNTVDEATKTGTVELRGGQPVFVLAKKGTLKELTAILESATVDNRIPVEINLVKNPDGLGLKLINHGNRNLDLHVTFEAPKALANEFIFLDLYPQFPIQNKALSFMEDPAAGSEVTVKVIIEAGLHGIRREVREIKVRF